MNQELQRPGMLKERCGPRGDVAASRIVAGALHGPRNDFAESGSVAGTLRGARSNVAASGRVA